MVEFINEVADLVPPAVYPNIHSAEYSKTGELLRVVLGGEDILA